MMDGHTCCPHCNQFIKPRYIANHITLCSKDVFKIWKAKGENIPSRKDGGQTMYICIICGNEDRDRDKLIAHMAKHSFLLLQRFNLDVIFNHFPEHLSEVESSLVLSMLLARSLWMILADINVRRALAAI